MTCPFVILRPDANIRGNGRLGAGEHAVSAFRDDPNGIERAAPWKARQMSRSLWWRLYRWGSERERWRHRERA
jgi:hypothetical protein